MKKKLKKKMPKSLWAVPHNAGMDSGEWSIRSPSPTFIGGTRYVHVAVVMDIINELNEHKTGMNSQLSTLGVELEDYL